MTTKINILAIDTEAKQCDGTVSGRVEHTANQPEGAETGEPVSGLGAVAHAVRQAGVDVIALPPFYAAGGFACCMHSHGSLTQSTSSTQHDTDSGDPKLVRVDSEPAGLATALGAMLAGTRTCCLTTMSGLRMAADICRRMASMRLPMVMMVQRESASERPHTSPLGPEWGEILDMPLIQLHASTVQEAYDLMLQAYRIAEDPRVRLPVIVTLQEDPAEPTAEPFAELSDAEAGSYVGSFVPPVDLLDTDNPRAVGPALPESTAAPFSAQIAEAMRWAPEVIREVGAEFSELTGRTYDLIDTYELEDSEVAIVATTGSCTSFRSIADQAQANGTKAGFVRVRTVRPFPSEAVASGLNRQSLKAVGVIDQSGESGSGGPLYGEIARSLLQRMQSDTPSPPRLVNIIVPPAALDRRDTQLTVLKKLRELATLGAVPEADPVYFLNDPATPLADSLETNNSQPLDSDTRSRRCAVGGWDQFDARILREQLLGTDSTTSSRTEQTDHRASESEQRIASKPSDSPDAASLMGTQHGLGAGHAACPGCPGPSIIQATLHAAREGLGVEPVVTFATSCLQVATSLYPYNAWRVPFLHGGKSGFAAVAGGLDEALRLRRQRGELPEGRRMKIIAFTDADAAFADRQTLASVLQTRYDITFVCYNTQRGGSTGRGASSSASRIPQNPLIAPDLTRLFADHHPPYIAQASIHDYDDFAMKLRRGIATEGPSFVNVLSSCPAHWGLPDTEQALSSVALAVETNLWPLYEIEGGRCRINYRADQPRPLGDYLRCQRRFQSMLNDENQDLLRRLQEMVDINWEALVRSEAASD